MSMPRMMTFKAASPRFESKPFSCRNRSKTCQMCSRYFFCYFCNQCLRGPRMFAGSGTCRTKVRMLDPGKQGPPPRPWAHLRSVPESFLCFPRLDMCCLEHFTTHNCMLAVPDASNEQTLRYANACVLGCRALPSVAFTWILLTSCCQMDRNFTVKRQVTLWWLCCSSYTEMTITEFKWSVDRRL
jgi:hypothetical protein